MFAKSHRKTRTEKHWCPNHCGKKVQFEKYLYEPDAKKGMYKCSKCRKRFTRNELT